MEKKPLYRKVNKFSKPQRKDGALNLKQESIIKTDISQPKFNLFPSSFKIKIDNPTIFDV